MWNKTISIVLLIILLTVLAGCNIPTGPIPSSTPDAVGTQVAQLLTAAPTFTQPAPADLPTDTPLPAAPTLAPPVEDTQAAPATAAAAVPTLTPTFPSGDPKSTLGAPTWRNTLDTGKPFYTFDNDNTRVVMENGALVLSGLTSNGWLGWSLTFSQPAQNFYLEAIFNTQTCSGGDMYGLVFRAPSTDAGYFFGITCDGKYNLRARDFTDGTNISLIQLTANSAIQPGSNQTNRLGVMANGEKIGLYANGILLQELTDSAYNLQGDFGALIAANETTGFTVKMDEITLWKLP